MPRTVAIIPARGGSKGIPRKNLQRVGGRTLLARSVLHARACQAIHEVVVSTDDAEIAAEARRAGAGVIERPAELSGDTASTESAVAHALSILDQGGDPVRLVALLQCTSPFRAPGQLDGALARLHDTGCDAVFSVVPFHGFVWRPDGATPGVCPATYDPGRRPRRQEIRDVWLETGSFYVFRRELFERTGSRMGGHIEPFAVPPEDALEIDDASELELARWWCERRGERDAGLVFRPRWLILDVDGTLTDGAMTYGEDGGESKRFHTWDGVAIRRFRARGGRVAFITGESSDAVLRRAAKLGVDHVVLGCADKASALQELCDRFEVPPAQIAAMGDDLGDLPWAGRVGLFAAPADARPVVRASADLVTSARGGHGAVRELVDLLLGESDPESADAPVVP